VESGSNRSLSSGSVKEWQKEDEGRGAGKFRLINSTRANASSSDRQTVRRSDTAQALSLKATRLCFACIHSCSNTEISRLPGKCLLAARTACSDEDSSVASDIVLPPTQGLEHQYVSLVISCSNPGDRQALRELSQVCAFVAGGPRERAKSSSGAVSCLTIQY
jgi:hypothetical protein